MVMMPFSTSTITGLCSDIVILLISDGPIVIIIRAQLGSPIFRI
jgi:hypothetical protein